jgi:hypothetical protein
MTIAFGVGALAVYLLGPIVKAAGFATLLGMLAAVSVATAVAVSLLPRNESAVAASRHTPA